MLTAALRYAELGLFVLPLHTIRDGTCTCGNAACRAPGKHPLNALVAHGVKQATREESLIREWWGREPDANIGIATGRGSGVFVVDVDVRNGGDYSIESLPYKLPISWMVITGGGGWHLYLRYPQGDIDVPSRSGVLGSGVDVKGRGGYVVAPPSLHASGVRYEWEVEGSYDDVPLADAPREVLEAATAKRVSDFASGADIPQGARNEVLFQLACSMRRGAGSPASVIAAGLHAENAARCRPMLPSDEVDNIAERVAQYEAGDPLLAYPERLLAAWRRGTVGAEYELSISRYAGEQEPGNEDDDWLVRYLLPRNAASLIAGPPKAAKSLLALDLAISLALGVNGLGADDFVTMRQAKVLFLPLEDPKRTTQRRLWRMCRGRGIEPAELEGLLAVDSDLGFRFDIAQHQVMLRRAIEKLGAELVIVDSLARSFSGDENDKQALSEALLPWAEIVRTTGCSVCAIHHYRKATTDAQGNALPLGLRLRGSGDLFAFVRHVVGVERTAAHRVSAIETVGNFEYQLSEARAFRSASWIDERGAECMRLGYAGTLAEALAAGSTTLVAAVREILVQRGALGVRDLLQALRERGLEVGELHLRSVLGSDADFAQTPRRLWRLA